MSEFSRVKRVSAALALAIGAGACSSPTVGNGFVASEHHCVSYDATVKLGVNEFIYLAGDDLSAEGSDAHPAIQDRMQILNKDGTHIRLSGTSDSTLDFGDTPSKALADGHGYELTADAPDVPTTHHFVYEEEGKKVSLNLMQSEKQQIAVNLHQTC